MEQSAVAAFVDVIFVIICLRIIYIAAARGVFCEAIKLVGLLIGSFFAFQYYSLLGSTVGQSISFLDKRQFHLVTFLVILLGIRAVFSLLGLIARLLFKRQDISTSERWIAAVVGGVRAILIFSIVIFIFQLTSFNPENFSNSIACNLFRNAAPRTYIIAHSAFTTIFPKFFVNKKVEDYVNLSKNSRIIK